MTSFQDSSPAYNVHVNIYDSSEYIYFHIKVL